MLPSKMIKKNNLIRKKSTKGDVIKIINKKSKYFNGFGEVYFSEIKQNKVKGWKKHTKMIMNLKVLRGKVKFVFLTNKNRFKKIILSENDLSILTVPKNIIFAFKGIKKKNIIMNFANINNTPGECLSFPINSFNYDWRK